MGIPRLDELLVQVIPMGFRQALSPSCAHDQGEGGVHGKDGDEYGPGEERHCIGILGVKGEAEEGEAQEAAAGVAHEDFCG